MKTAPPLLEGVRAVGAQLFGTRRRVSLQLILALVLSFIIATTSRAQNEPILVPDVVDYSKLLPILPDAPSGWTADKPEGSTTDVGGFQITTVHPDYRKSDAADSPTTAISILDSVANPDYVQATTAAWNQNSQTPEGYSKSVTIDGNPGFEAYEKEVKTMANGEKKEQK